MNTDLYLTDIQEEAHSNSKAHGFWEGTANDNIPTKIALIHSEVSEALECFREGDMQTHYREDGKPEGFPSELADIVIRVGDLAERLGINLSAEIATKFAYNRTREMMHGGKAV